MENENEKRYKDFLTKLKVTVLFETLETLLDFQPEVMFFMRALVKHGCPIEAILGAMAELAKAAPEEDDDDE